VFFVNVQDLVRPTCHPSFFEGFATETAPFITECGEDENDNVVGQAQKLKDAVERIAGKIDGL
jgi:hypothetical protein